ncbi:MAG TPA: class I SAM-dependent methyltransferase [Kribbellaceae bacterium]|nr:class I SAM-dependent methyltransferase [Kribbellaceae bacterium]
MRLSLHGFHHHNMPRVFEGRGSRVYDLAARTLLRGVYRRLAADIAGAAPHGAAVLDVGTGPGVLLAELARRRPDLELTGIDLSADMVAAANRNLSRFGGRATVLAASVTDLPFPDRSFDLIVSSFSLHHWDHPEAAAPELARVLRPGGRLQIYDFRFAPFDKLATAARGTSLWTGQPPSYTPIRTGIPFLFGCVRQAMP